MGLRWPAQPWTGDQGQLLAHEVEALRGIAVGVNHQAGNVRLEQVHVVPYHLIAAAAGHLENAALVGIGDQHVAVRQWIGHPALVGIEAVALTAVIAPDDPLGDGIELDHPAAAGRLPAERGRIVVDQDVAVVQCQPRAIGNTIAALT